MLFDAMTKCRLKNLTVQPLNNSSQTGDNQTVGSHGCSNNDNDDDDVVVDEGDGNNDFISGDLGKHNNNSNSNNDDNRI